MKKIILFIMTVVVIVSVFAACSSVSVNNKESESKNTTVSETNKNDNKDNNETTKIVENLVTTAISKIPVEDAEISGYDATKLISDKDPKSLGLKGKTEDYKFMLVSEGKEIDGKNYIEIVAMETKKENEDGTMDVETKGDYFVSYDGKKLLVRDLVTGEFSEIK